MLTCALQCDDVIALSTQAAQKAIRGMGVPVCTDGNQLYNATYGSTKAMGRLPPGGAMLVVWGFVNENYDDSITCYGGSLGQPERVARHQSSAAAASPAESAVAVAAAGGAAAAAGGAAAAAGGAAGGPSAKLNGLPAPPTAANAVRSSPSTKNATGTATADSPDFYWYCYGDDAEQESAFEPLWAYLRQHSAEDPPANGQIQMLQAHWQYDAAAITQGTLHASSILDDESRAQVNSKVADAVLCAPCPQSGGVFKWHNLIEVDNVCDASPKLFNAFRSRVPPNR